MVDMIQNDLFSLRINILSLEATRGELAEVSHDLLFKDLKHKKMTKLALIFTKKLRTTPF